MIAFLVGFCRGLRPRTPEEAIGLIFVPYGAGGLALLPAVLFGLLPVSLFFHAAAWIAGFLMLVGMAVLLDRLGHIPPDDDDDDDDDGGMPVQAVRR